VVLSSLTPLRYVQPIPNLFIVLDIKDYNISSLIAPLVIQYGMQQRVVSNSLF
jgi:hypothetical protein